VVDKPGAVDIEEVEGRVTLENVSFAYDNRKPALEHISIDIKPGTSVAIVGESGSGKSTLLRLLYRFYDASGGCIKIDGRPVDSITIESLRSHLGVVPQETMLFNDTLMYNLLYANPSATEEQVFAACRAASMHDNIMAFPDGYKTMVGERGLKLSGGEKQRVSLSVLTAFQIVLTYYPFT
jgi:ABC-type multidrug transport system fused ATPase/permease subunit